MFHLAILLFLLSLLCADAPAQTAPSAADPCLACHEKETPSIVTHWKESGHAKQKVSCSACHGGNVEANHAGKAVVEASRCGGCHENAYSSHRASRHGIGLKTGRGCTRGLPDGPEKVLSCTFCHRDGSSEPIVHVDCAMFLAQSGEMQRQGCVSCHQVETRCDTCHTKHGTDLRVASSPYTCGVCHMGPDHPQLEMWETSVHGALFREGKKDLAPSCVSCHMKEGSHNVSRGITAGLPDASAARRDQERSFMVGICSSCHTRRLAERNLADGDRIEQQGRKLMEEARDVVAGLEKDGLLETGHKVRPDHPLLGKDVVIGPPMLYENLSFAESLFFKVKQFFYPTSFKAVYHQNPDYAHWYGNAPLKLTVSEIRSHAALLRRVSALSKRLDNRGGPAPGRDGGETDLKRQIRDLNDRFSRGLLNEDEYREKKVRLLDDSGL